MESEGWKTVTGNAMGHVLRRAACGMCIYYRVIVWNLLEMEAQPSHIT